MITFNIYLSEFGFINNTDITNNVRETFLSEILGQNVVKQSKKIEMNAITHGSKEFLSLYKYDNNEIILAQATPFLLPDGELYGYKYTHSSPHNGFNLALANQIMKKQKNNWIVLDNVSNIELSKRDEIILSMLVSGYTQQEIAQKLGCSQPFIAKIIATVISPKFGLTTSSSSFLISAAIEQGFSNFIPRELIITN